MKKYDFLKEISLLNKLEPKTLKKIADASKIKRYKKGSMIIKEEDISEGLYIIKSGEARVARVSIIGLPKAKKDFARLKKRDFFGELSLLGTYPTVASVISKGNVECVFIEGKTFMEIIASTPKTAFYVMWVFALTLANRLRETDLKLFEYMRQEAGKEKGKGKRKPTSKSKEK